MSEKPDPTRAIVTSIVDLDHGHWYAVADADGYDKGSVTFSKRAWRKTETGKPQIGEDFPVRLSQITQTQKGYRAFGVTALDV